MSTIKSQTLFETIDLTGNKPVVRSRLIEKQITIHDIDADDANNNNIPTSSSHPVITSLIDRRLRKCEVCLEEFCKYTCPGCKMKTCCLSCVQKHKKMTGCNGTRNRTEFVAKSKFDNFHLLNDYRFLEEADRIADNAKRDYKNVVGKIPRKDQILKKNAGRSGVHLFRMAKGMKRWRENKSYYNIKDKTLFWTMKLIFDDIKEEILTKQAESLTFGELLSKYIDEKDLSIENRKKFIKYAKSFQEGTVKIFFKQELDTGNSNLRYTELCVTDTIKEGLKDRSVLEYPVFHVVLPTDSRRYREELFIPVPESDGSEENDADTSDESEDDEKLQPVAKQRRITRD